MQPLLSAGSTTGPRLSDYSSVVLHSASNTSWQRCQTCSSQLTHSFILSSSPSSSTVLSSIPVFRHSLTLPCTTIYLSICLPAFLGHSCPSHFHSYNALFCFHAGWMDGWMVWVGGGREGGMDGGMISLMLQQHERRRRSRQ